MRIQQNTKATANAKKPAAPTKPDERGSIGLKPHLAEGIYTTAPVEVGESGFMSPEFIRVHDCERLFGLKRGLIYTLLRDRVIKSVCLRRPGARTGVRLLHTQSIREALAKLLV